MKTKSVDCQASACLDPSLQKVCDMFNTFTEITEQPDKNGEIDKVLKNLIKDDALAIVNGLSTKDLINKHQKTINDKMAIFIKIYQNRLQ